MAGQGSPSVASGQPAAGEVAAAAEAVVDAVNFGSSPSPCQTGPSEPLVGADPWAPQVPLPAFAFAAVVAVAVACGAGSRWEIGRAHV